MNASFRTLWVGAVGLVILLAACAGGESPPVEPPGSLPVQHTGKAKEGESGVFFQNGVECLGENAHPLALNEIYLAPDGDDANPGTRDAPLGSLAFALCNLKAGQTVYILPGTYHESVILASFGSQSAATRIIGVPDSSSGALPVLDGENIRTVGIALSESTNFIVENLEFRNYTDEGFYLLVGSQYEVRGNRFIANGRASVDPDFDGEGFGITTSGTTQVTIENNESAFNGPNQQRWQNYTLGTGIDTYALLDGVIRNNDIHDNIGGGILVEDGGNVLVEGNHIYQNELDANGDYWDGGIWVDGSKDVTLQDNVITDNHGAGIEISDEDLQYPQTSRGVVVNGNTLSGNLFGLYIWNYGVCPAPDEAVILGENQIESVKKDVWCQEWTCGENQPCN